MSAWASSGSAMLPVLARTAVSSSPAPKAHSACTAAVMLAKMSERRNNRMIDESLSGYPSFCIANPGLNSGLMIPQYTQAGLINEMRGLATPSTIDNTPTCGNQEDYVAMGYPACKKSGPMAEKLESVLAIELLSAYQVQQFVDPDVKRSPATQAVLDEIAKHVPVLKQDDFLFPYIQYLKDFIHSGALIRATEGTVLDRIPPRARVRRNAPIELPHVMLLIDDPDKTVIEPLTAAADGMEKVYDFDLMENGGHIKGFKLSASQIDAVADALTGLTTDEAMKSKYGVSGVAPLLFAVGDGNHSLATAKACYEDQKKGKTPEEYLALPARYALVEVVNNHDDALQFEPIHRVLFGVDHEKFMEEFKKFYPNTREGKGEGHTIEVCWAGHDDFITVPDPKVQLAVGTLQAFIDEYLKKFGGEVDYIHGDEVTRELGSKEGNMGFLLPAMGKEQLFKTVMADGVLPRKTFSMGHAQDKRYYVEARKIR